MLVNTYALLSPLNLWITSSLLKELTSRTHIIYRQRYKYICIYIIIYGVQEAQHQQNKITLLRNEERLSTKVCQRMKYKWVSGTRKMIRITSHQGNASINHKEASSYPNCHSKSKADIAKQQMLTRLWITRRPNARLVGTETGANCTEVGLDIPQKTTSRSPTQSSYLLPGDVKSKY